MARAARAAAVGFPINCRRPSYDDMTGIGQHALGLPGLGQPAWDTGAGVTYAPRVIQHVLRDFGLGEIAMLTARRGRYQVLKLVRRSVDTRIGPVFAIVLRIALRGSQTSPLRYPNR
jgi:hypothetical protein